jgi:hypothetical protein
MGDLIELKRAEQPIPQGPWITTLVVCFNCTERWVAVMELDIEGRARVNKIECPYCGEFKAVAIAEMIEQHWRSVREVERRDLT